MYEDVLMPEIGRLVVCELVSDSISQMRSVSDIPRLYRRTNKEAPTKCSAYVHKMLARFQKFFDENGEKGDFIRDWLKRGISAVSQQLVLIF